MLKRLWFKLGVYWILFRIGLPLVSPFIWFLLLLLLLAWSLGHV